MTFRVQRSTVYTDVVWRVSGDITVESADDLRALLDAAKERPVIFDLAEVGVVDRAGVLFLAERERRGARLTNCPAYVREWIEREREGVDDRR